MIDLIPFLYRKSPRTFADYYRFGAEYTIEVAEEMGFDRDGRRGIVREGVDAMTDGQVDVSTPVADSIAAILLGDAEYYGPFADWMSHPWRFLIKFRWRPATYALRKLGNVYYEQSSVTDYPGYSDPSEVTIDGVPASEYISGYEDQFVLAAAILHTEWYEQAAPAHGISVPESLVERTIDESKRYYTGQLSSLSEDVREFQYHLFVDVDWIRNFETRYGRASPLSREGINPTAQRSIETLEDVRTDLE